MCASGKVIGCVCRSLCLSSVTTKIGRSRYLDIRAIVVNRYEYGALSTLRKTQTHLPLATRKMLYKSLVLPHLEYCPSIWDPSTIQLTDQVERVQNRAMRTILDKPSRTHSALLRAKLGWRPLADRRKLRRALTCHRILHKTAPGYLHGLFSLNTNTKGRNKDKLYIVRPATNWMKNSFVYKTSILWNSLSTSTREAKTYSSFVSNFYSNLPH